MREQTKKTFIILAAGLILAIATHFFLAPSKLAIGGMSGTAIIINSVVPAIPVGIVLLIGNLLLFLIGFLILGKQFGILTLLGTIVYSLWTIFLEWLKPNPAPLVNDPLIATFMGSALTALAVSLMFLQNASTGGTDIVAKIIHLYTRIPLSFAMFLADGIVVILSGILISLPNALYAVIGLYVQSVIMDQVLTGMEPRYVLNITSAEWKKINDFINYKMKRGTSIFPSKGGFSEHPHNVIVTVVHRSEYVRIRDFIEKTDEHAFVFVYPANEVMGEGFTYPPVAQPYQEMIGSEEA